MGCNLKEAQQPPVVIRRYAADVCTGLGNHLSWGGFIRPADVHEVLLAFTHQKVNILSRSKPRLASYGRSQLLRGCTAVKRRHPYVRISYLIQGRENHEFAVRCDVEFTHRNPW